MELDLDAVVEQESGLAARLADGSRLGLPMLGQLEEGREVTLGIRPEHLRFSSQGLPARIFVIEPLGMSTQITLDASGQHLTLMTIERPRVASGDDVRLSIDPELVHIFDRKSGRRLN